MKSSRIIIITGQSGSGKSTAMGALEDAGYYCVDNLPVVLLPKFLEMPAEKDSQFTGLGFVMDLREKGFILRQSEVIRSLRQTGYRLEIIFLEADETVLLQRFSQTRRQHPLSRDKGLQEGIRTEKEQLGEMRAAADRVIDTSAYNVHQLKSVIFRLAAANRELAPMKIQVMSFGFKNGLPRHADLVMDVRFLPNPYFVEHLKARNGRNPEVTRYVLDHSESERFLGKYYALLDYLLPRYVEEGKAYLTIAVGCTGGRHRSVAVAHAVFEHLANCGMEVELTHRDIGLQPVVREPSRLATKE